MADVPGNMAAAESRSLVADALSFCSTFEGKFIEGRLFGVWIYGGWLPSVAKLPGPGLMSARLGLMQRRNRFRR